MSAPHHTFRIVAFALMLAGLAGLTATAVSARGLGGGGVGGGPSMGSINIGPRLNSGISNPGDRVGNQNTTPASAKKKKKKGKPQQDYLIIKMETIQVTN